MWLLFSILLWLLRHLLLLLLLHLPLPVVLVLLLLLVDDKALAQAQKHYNHRKEYHR